MENVEPLTGIILPYFNFFLFLGLAFYFFRKPAQQAARKRREEFERALKEASKAKEEADRRLADLNARHKTLDHEVEEILRMAKEVAEADAAKILEDAERLASHLREEAKRVAEAEIGRARNLIRREILEAVHAGVVGRIKTELGTGQQLDLARKRIVTLQNLRAEG